MDPLSALGLTSGIVQLIDFTTNLIRTGVEIHCSLDGTTLNNQNLENVCERMHRVLEAVKNLPPSRSQPGWLKRNVDGAEGSLRSLCDSCRTDCEEILGVLQELKTKNGGHKRWGAMAAVFKSLMKRRKLDEIEVRLNRTQAAVSMHLSVIMRDEISHVKTAVDRITRQSDRLGIGLDTDCKLLSQRMDALQLEVYKADSNTKSSHPRVSKDLIDKISDIIEDLHSKNQTVTARQAILISLRFRDLPVRHEAIPDAFQGTFNWIYNAGHFRTWLESGNGIFWISGKPGAGKSTLMKYLAQNPMTQEYLNDWAAPSKAVIVDHYFWNLGTPLQRSLHGMLRTLVFHILRQIPSSIPTITPSLWQSAMDNYTTVEAKYEWPMSDLLNVTEKIAQCGDLGFRLCLFIDGLDEFEGNHLSISDQLISLTKSPNIKICLSSRPWNAFVDKFGGNRDGRLDVHELTGDDIKKFANEQLQSHHLWDNTLILAEEKQSLVEEIRTRANGVFLWVALVTKSLCDGLTNRDTIYDLRRRLELLPVDLENLFRLILDRVDRAYLQKSTEYLQLALHQENRLPAEAFLYHERDHEDGNYAISWRTREISGAELDGAQEWTRRRISALTGGLLEVHQSHNPYVDFLHRTVAEFLRDRETSEYLHSRMRPNFDVYVALIKMELVILKTRSTLADTSAYGFNAEAVFRYAKNAEEKSFALVSNLLDTMEMTMEGLLVSNRLWVLSARNSAQVAFRQPLLESEFTEYASRRLQQDRFFFASLPSSPMETILIQRGSLPNFRMISVLHQFGHSLNESTNEAESPWCRYFKSFVAKNLNDHQYLDAFKELIHQGADPNANLHYSRCDQSVFSAFLGLAFSYYFLDANPSLYLSTLDAFLDHGADFAQRIEHRRAGPVDERYWWPQKLDSRYDTVAKVFHRALSLVGSDDRIKSNRELVFETTKRILSKRANDPSLTSGLRSTIIKAFPESMALVLCSLMSSKKSGNRRQQPKKRKRVLETSQHRRRPGKRARTTC